MAREKWLYLTLKVFDDCPLPSGIAWVPRQQLEPCTLLSPCRLPGSVDFPFWSNEEQSRCDTEQISNTSLMPTWEAVEPPFNYSSAFSMAKRNRNTILMKAKMICLQLIPINTFQVTGLSGKWWFSHGREQLCEGFIFSLWKSQSRCYTCEASAEGSFLRKPNHMFLITSLKHTQKIWKRRRI